MSFVRAKKDWIQSKQALVKKQNASYQPKRYIDGEKFLFLGDHYPLVIVPNQRQSLMLVDGHFKLRRASLERAEKAFIHWYRTQAREIFASRAMNYCERVGLVFDRIRITGARTRWGSCSSSGSLNFTWRLVMAPLEVIDYVVVHELVHLVVPNHSDKYWKKVAEIKPDYRLQREWLKENGRQLKF